MENKDINNNALAMQQLMRAHYSAPEASRIIAHRFGLTPSMELAASQLVIKTLQAGKRLRYQQ